MTERRPLAGPDEGFAVVLGAMVMLGVVLIAFTTYQTTVAPGIEAGSEAQQLQTAADRLTQWAATSTQADPSLTDTTVTAIVPLGHGSAPLASSSSTSTLRFDPGEHTVRLDARELSVTRLNGTMAGGTDETWESTDNDSLTEIVAVDRFRLRLAEIDSSHVGESVTVNVTGEAGEHVGDLRVSVEGTDGGSDSQGFELTIRTRDAQGTVLFDQPILISSTTHDSHSDPISPYWVDLLEDSYQFDHVVGSADPPFEISLDQDGLSSDYTIQYVEAGASQQTKGNGRTVENYNVSRTSGVVRFDGHADHAEDQTLTLEHGALVRSQRDGDLFAKAPNFVASLSGHDVHVAFSWPSLTGKPAAVAAGSNVLLDGTPTDRYAVEGQATNLTVNVTTQHPKLYVEAFGDELEDAGLTDGRGFETAHGDDWARVDVWGLTHPDPNSERYDLTVSIQSTTMAVRLG